MDWTVQSVGWDSVAFTSSHPNTIIYFENRFSDYTIRESEEGWRLKEQSSGRTKHYQCHKAKYSIYPNGRHRLSFTGSDAEWLTGKNTPSHSRCTRCDLQITGRATSSIPTIISQEYQHLRKEHSKTRRQTYLGIIDSTKGRTLYYGSSDNGNMGRMYDKGRQLKIAPDGELIRWEVEWTKKSSNQIYQQGRLLTTEKEQLRDWAAAWFSKRKFRMPNFGQSTCEALRVAREQSDDERQLAWLTEQVQPVLRHLASRGKLQAATEALGLPPLE